MATASIFKSLAVYWHFSPSYTTFQMLKNMIWYEDWFASRVEYLWPIPTAVFLLGVNIIIQIAYWLTYVLLWQLPATRINSTDMTEMEDRLWNPSVGCLGVQRTWYAAPWSPTTAWICSFPEQLAGQILNYHPDKTVSINSSTWQAA